MYCPCEYKKKDAIDTLQPLQIDVHVNGQELCDLVAIS